MKSQIRPAIVCFVLLTVLTGGIYPALVTLVAQTVFSSKANGSLIWRDDRAVGSLLIGQPFSDAKYFWPRPSACSYDGAAGAGSNLGPTNPARFKAMDERRSAQQDANSSQSGQVPVDLLTASASGLDPHITPAAAEYQVERVARARNMTAVHLREVVASVAQSRAFGLLGEPRVNVMRLNLMLDHPELFAAPAPTTLPSIHLYRWRGFVPD